MASVKIEISGLTEEEARSLRAAFEGIKEIVRRRSALEGQMMELRGLQEFASRFTPPEKTSWDNRVLETVLGLHRGGEQEVTIGEVCRAMGLMGCDRSDSEDRKMVSRCLSTLAMSGALENVRRGVYRVRPQD